MGCARPARPSLGTPQADGGARAGAPAPKKKEQEHPDLGLSGSHELVQFLGRGGTGDTFLFKDRATDEEVAIKLVRRPVPKVIQPALLREIRVRSADETGKDVCAAAGSVAPATAALFKENGVQSAPSLTF